MAEENQNRNYGNQNMDNEQAQVSITYKKRLGTDNVGFKYEQNMAALYALRFSLNKNVKDVSMATNVEDFGVFDDLILRVQYHHTIIPELYAIQFRHKTSENYRIRTNELIRDFSFERYKNSYEKVVSKLGDEFNVFMESIPIDAIRFCLVTNAKFKKNTVEFPLESASVTRELKSTSDLIYTKSNFFNTFHIANPTTTIQHEYSTFFRNFRFYDKQANWTEAKEEIKYLLESRFELENDDVAEEITQFINAWFQQNHILTKKIVKTKLLQILTGITDNAQLRRKYETFEDVTGINEYDQRVKLLKEVKISVQGRAPLSLYELTNETFHKTVPDLFLLRNIKETVNVGGNGFEKPKNYIDRRFYKVLLERGVFWQTKKNIFLLNVRLPFSSIGRIQTLTDLRTNNFFSSHFDGLNLAIIIAGNEFTETIKHIKEHKDLKSYSLHHVSEYNARYLEWKRSWSDPENLRKFVVHEGYVDEQEALNYFKSELNVVNAIPGMGKTTILNSLAGYCEPDVLALRLDLNTHEEDLRDENSELRQDPLMYIFERMISGENEEFEEKVFNNLKEEKRLMLFVDAFDEISPTHTDAVLSIIEKLKGNDIPIWVFTRPHAQSFLQKRFGVIPTDLVPLGNDQICDYLVQTVGQEEYGNPNDFLTDNLRNLCNAPLYLYMLSTLIREGRLNIRDLKITDLYDEFIEMSYQQHMEKRNIKNDANSTIDLVELYKSIYLAVHKMAALVVIFGKDYLLEKKILKEDNLKSIKDFKTGRKNYELIVPIDDETPIFSHRTFAEYFAAIQIYEYLQKGKFQVLYKLLFQWKYKEVRLMFDRITTKELPFHLAVVEKDVDKLKTLCVSSNMFERDEFDRTVLHFPMNYSKLLYDGERETVEILNLLMRHFKQNEAILKQRDHILNLNFYEHWNQFENESLLHLAATWGLTNIVECVPHVDEMRKDINKRSLDGKFPIHCAAENGYVSVIKLLKENYECIDKIGPYGQTALHYAVRNQHVECVEFLIKEGADMHCRDNDYSCAPIHYAAGTGNMGIIKQLIEADGIDDIDGEGRIALHYASEYGHEDAVNCLITCGLDVNKKDNEGTTPTHCAAANGHVNIIRLLKKNGGRIYDVDSKGWTALHYACERGSEDCVKYIINDGTHVNQRANDGAKTGHPIDSNINLKVNDGRTPLHFSAARGEESVLKLLIEARGNIYETDSTGNTPLHYASRNGHVKCIEYLLNEISENLISYVNQKAKFGRTSMHFSASNGHIDTIKLLKEKGGGIDDSDQFEATALHFAASRKNLNCCLEEKRRRKLTDPILEEKHLDCMEYLLKESSKLKTSNSFVNQQNIFGRTAMHSAATNENIDAMELLIQHGGRIDVRDSLRMTAMHLAVLSGSEDCLRSLLRAGANMNKKAIDGSTLLHFCAQRGYTNIIRFLKLREEGNINEINSFGETCLHHASFKGHTECVQYLLEEGLDVNQKTCRAKVPLPDTQKQLLKEYVDNELEEECLAYIRAACFKENSAVYRTPMHYAAAGGHVEVMELLKERGGRLDYIDSEGLNAFHYAAYNANVQCLNYLLNPGAEVNRPTMDRGSIIHSGAENRNVQLKSASVNKINSEDETPGLTATKRRPKILENLI